MASSPLTPIPTSICFIWSSNPYPEFPLPSSIFTSHQKSKSPRSAPLLFYLPPLGSWTTSPARVRVGLTTNHKVQNKKKTKQVQNFLFFSFKRNAYTKKPNPGMADTKNKLGRARSAPQRAQNVQKQIKIDWFNPVSQPTHANHDPPRGRGINNVLPGNLNQFTGPHCAH